MLWLVSGKHRRSFQAINAFMHSHPDTTFIFISPFPCLLAADNSLRALGGWLLRRQLATLPNCYWLDSHQLLHQRRDLFVDQSHLNAYGHQALAYALAAILLSSNPAALVA